MDSSTANSRKEIILDLFRTQRFSEAKTLSEALCREQPQDAEAWQLLGVVHGALGEIQAAEVCFRRAIEFFPDHLKAHRNLVQALMNQGKTQEAEILLKKALHSWEIQPGGENLMLAKSQSNLAAFYVSENRPQEARGLWQKALAIRQKYLEESSPVILALHNNLAALELKNG